MEKTVTVGKCLRSGLRKAFHLFLEIGRTSARCRGGHSRAERNIRQTKFLGGSISFGSILVGQVGCFQSLHLLLLVLLGGCLGGLKLGLKRPPGGLFLGQRLPRLGILAPQALDQHFSLKTKKLLPYEVWQLIIFDSANTLKAFKWRVPK